MVTINIVALIDHILTVGLLLVLMAGCFKVKHESVSEQWIDFGLFVWMIAAIVFHFLPK